MDQIDKYKRVKEDQLQGKGKQKVIPQERRDFRLDRYNSNRLRRDFVGQSGVANTQTVNAVFREPVHRMFMKIKNEPYFKWPNKIAGESTRHNQNFYCQYYQDHEHTTKNSRNLWNYLQLVREGNLKHLLYHSSSHQGQTYQEPQKDTALGPPIGTIDVIVAVLGRIGTRPLRVLSVAQLPAEESQSEPKRAKMKSHQILSFSKEDMIRTIQPHDDALVVTLRIRDYDVKRVMVVDDSAAKVMYPDLYKGLRLKLEYLMPYSSSLISFNGKIIIPKGMIRLPIQTGQEIVEMNFIVVDTYSPYAAIVSRPWLHTLGVVASSLHQKVKFLSGDQVLEIYGCQSTTRQCMVAAISHRLDAEFLASAERNL
nr:uncharacterized protein LOC111996050 [Quercus suber]XP_023917241.1 uncharacterized protein LOC112028779 [Quercus suber]